MIYLIVKSEGDYADVHTSILFYSTDKQLAENTLTRLEANKAKLYEAGQAIRKLDQTFFNGMESFYYRIEQVSELKNDYIDISYGEEAEEL